MSNGMPDVRILYGSSDGIAHRVRLTDGEQSHCLDHASRIVLDDDVEYIGMWLIEMNPDAWKLIWTRKP